MRAALALVAALIAAPAVAQPYPTRPIRLVIPSPPGGGTDTLGRLLKEGFTESWGQPIVVDNRGGASGRIAAAAVAKANPDGHTLLFTYGGVLATGLPLFKKLPYHPIRDFAPVAMMAHIPGVLVAHPSFPAKTLAELIKLAKAKPGALTYGTASLGATSHLNMELLKQMAGLDMHGVSYNGDAPQIVALLGGHVLFGFVNTAAAMPHMQSGKLRPIAVATAQRNPALPDVPSVAEAGVPGYEALLFYCLVAPARTPGEVIAKLNDAVTRTKHAPAVKQALASLGAVPVDMTPPELGAFIERELAKWTRVIEQGNIKAD
ncbi:MAG TPA: tripartite tricarboxylate transporter substrate binding protein [Burkholderiales bacterium]|nr:tripartite tricarboxylate transporter substrate binding protein [Burkholderiales bacterium]